LSHGQYICWVDSDDILISNKIEFQIDHLQKTGGDVSVSQASRFRNGNKTPYRKWRENITSDHLTEDLISGAIGWHTSSPLWNRNVIPDRPFNESLQGAQEWFFHILQSIRIPRSSFHFSDYSTVLIRESPESMTYSLAHGRRVANYLEARTALMHELSKLDQSKIKSVVDNSRKLAKQIVNDPGYFDAVSKFADALFIYDKPRWMKLKGIIYFNKITGMGERLFNYL
jgi:hypothetical protein